MSTDTSRRRFAPPRLLILAAPAGTYLTITLAPEHGWADAGTVGGLVAAAVLSGPALLRAGAKAATAPRKPTPKPDPKHKR